MPGCSCGLKGVVELTERQISAKANSTTDLIRRYTNAASKDVELKAYTQLVRPFLEYASCSWDSVGKSRTQENKLEAEAVQTCSTGAMQQFVQTL